jgi:hypothetical protein
MDHLFETCICLSQISPKTRSAGKGLSPLA